MARNGRLVLLAPLFLGVQLFSARFLQGPGRAYTPQPPPRPQPRPRQPPRQQRRGDRPEVQPSVARKASRRVALLLDVECLRPHIIPTLKKQALKFGTVVEPCRAYVPKGELEEWEEALKEHGFSYAETGYAEVACPTGNRTPTTEPTAVAMAMDIAELSLMAPGSVAHLVLAGRSVNYLPILSRCNEWGLDNHFAISVSTDSQFEQNLAHMAIQEGVKVMPFRSDYKARDTNVMVVTDEGESSIQPVDDEVVKMVDDNRGEVDELSAKLRELGYLPKTRQKGELPVGEACAKFFFVNKLPNFTFYPPEVGIAQTVGAIKSRSLEEWETYPGKVVLLTPLTDKPSEEEVQKMGSEQSARAVRGGGPRIFEAGADSALLVTRLIRALGYLKKGATTAQGIRHFIRANKRSLLDRDADILHVDLTSPLGKLEKSVTEDLYAVFTEETTQHWKMAMGEERARADLARQGMVKGKQTTEDMEEALERFFYQRGCPLPDDFSYMEKVFEHFRYTQLGDAAWQKVFERDRMESTADWDDC